MNRLDEIEDMLPNIDEESRQLELDLNLLVHLDAAERLINRHTELVIDMDAYQQVMNLFKEIYKLLPTVYYPKKDGNT